MSDAVLSILCTSGDAGPLLRQQNCMCFRLLRYAGVPRRPAVVLILVAGHHCPTIWRDHWRRLILGNGSIAFAVPVYENVAVIKRHWMSLNAGGDSGSNGCHSSVWLARGFMLSDEIQRSLAVRSVTTPFALAAAGPLGG